MPHDQSQKPTLTSIANRLGVSAKTVSNAFNRPDQLSPTLRARILETAAEVGYRGPDPLARAFRQGRSRMVGVVYGNRLSHAFEDGAFVTFLAGLSDVLEDEGMGLALIPGPADGETRGVGVRDAVMDGAVVYSMAIDDPVLDDLRARDIPFVTVDQPEVEDAPMVGVHDREGGRLIASWVREQGHERIGVISFAMHAHPRGEVLMLNDLPTITLPVTGARLAGIANVFDAVTVPVAHVYGSSEDVGAQGARALLASHPDLTAWMCLADRMVVGALDVAREAGIDVQVTGFDGAIADAPFPTIRQPHRAKGEAAARMLLAVLRDETVESRRFPVELIVPQ